MKSSSADKSFNVKKSVARARTQHARTVRWSIKVGTKEYAWANTGDRIALIRKKLPYASIDVISKRVNSPVKRLLNVFGLPQTTYNKKKKDNDLLSGRDSELILLLTELLDFGVEVFDDEKDKFQRWLKKPNISLGGATPESLFDSVTGIQEVRNSLNRMEYGNMA